MPRGAEEEVNPKVLRDQLGLKTETPAQERLRKVKARSRAARDAGDAPPDAAPKPDPAD